MTDAAYDRLKARFARIGAINEAAGILHWDASAMMPPGGAHARGEQLAALAGVAHELLTDPRVAEDLAVATAAGEWEGANLALMRRAHLRATALPVDLVEASARANSACEKLWREAKAASDFALVAKALAEVVVLQREMAQAFGAALGMDPYDALMDGYQPGVSAGDVEPVFAAYEAWLRDALPRAEEIQARRPAPLPFLGAFPTSAQRALCQEMAERVGLQFSHARLDESLHPFCGGNPSDVRITTFYDTANPAKALLGVLEQTRKLSNPADGELPAKLEYLSVQYLSRSYFGNFETAREQPDTYLGQDERKIVPWVDAQLAALDSSANPQVGKFKTRWDYLKAALVDLNSQSTAMESASGRPFAPTVPPARGSPPSPAAAAPPIPPPRNCRW
jgi:hypothetical protein